MFMWVYTTRHVRYFNVGKKIPDKKSRVNNQSKSNMSCEMLFDCQKDTWDMKKKSHFNIRKKYLMKKAGSIIRGNEILSCEMLVDCQMGTWQIQKKNKKTMVK